MGGVDSPCLCGSDLKMLEIARSYESDGSRMRAVMLRKLLMKSVVKKHQPQPRRYQANPRQETTWDQGSFLNTRLWFARSFLCSPHPLSFLTALPFPLNFSFSFSSSSCSSSSKFQQLQTFVSVRSSANASPFFSSSWKPRLSFLSFGRLVLEISTPSQLHLSYTPFVAVETTCLQLPTFLLHPTYLDPITTSDTTRQHNQLFVLSLVIVAFLPHRSSVGDKLSVLATR